MIGSWRRESKLGSDRALAWFETSLGIPQGNVKGCHFVASVGGALRGPITLRRRDSLGCSADHYRLTTPYGGGSSGVLFLLESTYV